LHYEAHEAEEAFGRRHARQRRPEGSAHKKILTPAARREAVAHLRSGFSMSERRACTITRVDRKTIRYRSRRPADEALRARMRELAAERRRFGYRRLHVLLRQEGLVRNRKRTQRLYREEGLTVRRRRGRKRATGARAPLLLLALPNARWSIDFVHDQLACGRRFRILNVIDDVTKECLAAVADTSISGKRVARELAALVARRGRPAMIVSDHGTEFTSNAMLGWTSENRIAWHFIAPGKPMQNGICESFNGRMRDELLNRPRPRPSRHRALDCRLQRAPASLEPSLPDPGRLRRHPRRNGRPAEQPRPAPPFARCSVGATAPISTWDSGLRWMKNGGQVISETPMSAKYNLAAAKRRRSFSSVARVKSEAR
jgi:putative transposase